MVIDGPVQAAHRIMDNADEASQTLISSHAVGKSRDLKQVPTRWIE